MPKPRVQRFAMMAWIQHLGNNDHHRNSYTLRRKNNMKRHRDPNSERATFVVSISANALSLFFPSHNMIGKRFFHALRALASGMERICFAVSGPTKVLFPLDNTRLTFPARNVLFFPGTATRVPNTCMNQCTGNAMKVLPLSVPAYMTPAARRSFAVSHTEPESPGKEMGLLPVITV
jgi:hypothetical protein